jgi:hypothetical protein
LTKRDAITDYPRSTYNRTVLVSNPNAPQGLTASFQITDPISISLTPDQSVYQMGQPVQVTFAQTNTSDQPITYEPGGPDEFTISHDGTPLYLIVYPQIVIGSETLQAGRTQTVTQEWNSQDTPSLGVFTGTFVVGFGPENDPDQYSTTFQVEPLTPGALVTSVTTDQSVYDLGQPVNMAFSETNASDQPIAVLTGPSDFEASQDGSGVWDSSSVQIGPPPLTAASFPTGETNWTTLQPGQSYTQTATWNGLPTIGPLSNLSGTFTVTNAFDPQGDTATFTFAAPPSSQLVTSLTTDQSVYQLGQPIPLTFTETNVGTQPIQVLVGPSGFDVQQDGAEIWNSNFPNSSENYSLETLQPGQSVTQTATWNGVPEHLPAGEPSGIFVVTNELDPDGNQATFQIVAPSDAQPIISMTTDQSVYEFGEPVQLTFTETDGGDQPIAVLTGPTAFDVTLDGLSVFGLVISNQLPSASAWETLQPGQSYTQTYTWKNPEVFGDLIASNELNPTDSTAAFQILSPPPEPISPTSPTPTPTPSPSPPTTGSPSAPSGPASGSTLIDSTVSTNHQVYNLGQSVRIKVTIKEVGADKKDDGTAKVGLRETSKADGITVLEGSKVVWRSPRGADALKARSIRPGKAITLTTVWNGRPNQPGVTKLLPGTYTIQASEDGYNAVTTITIEGAGKKASG